jgi:hypothetical protein
MDLKLVPLYFLVGGTVVTLVTYVGSQANKGPLAAFIAFFPALTVITLCTVYWRGGSESALSYATCCQPGCSTSAQLYTSCPDSACGHRWSSAPSSTQRPAI